MTLRPLLLCACLLALPRSPRAQGGNQPGRPVFRAGTELVTVNVVVRDKSGAVVRGLRQNDFVVTEDGNPQAITSFDFEELDREEAPPPEPEPPAGAILEKRPTHPVPARPAAAAAVPLAEASKAPPAAKLDMRGRRLIVLFFDLSSMQPEEIERAVKAAREYVDEKLSPADLIAVASFATSFRVDQDFTADRDLLDTAIDAFSGASGQGFEEGMTGDAEGTPDTGAAFTPDDTEFNIFNTDRRLDALQSLSDALSRIEQKKSVIYFSSGMSQSGTGNQVELRRTIDRANRANVSLYAADMRGLVANVPGGEASQASTRGVSAFSGASVSSKLGSVTASQETLTTMAEDTGGRAFYDANAFGDVFQRVVADTSAYYILGYSSTNPSRDGRFRRIKVALAGRTDLKLEYRSGYYAVRDFAHSSRDDREQQLQEQLLSDLSATDLSTYVSAGYFRVAEKRFYVPLSLVVPGYQVPFTKSTDRSKATLDVLGLVRDDQRRPVGRIRDTVRIAVEGADDLARKTVQYESGLELAPGRYRMKFVVRENQSGTMGSYEADLVVPDLKDAPVKVSSVIVGTRFEEGARKDDRNPLVRNGSELVPNVTHVVSPGQHLYFYYEVYEPAAVDAGRAAPAEAGKPAGSVDTGKAGPAPAQPRGIRVLTSIAFFRGRVRVFETPPIETTALNAPDRRTAVFRFDVPAASLPPGVYTCQVNVVDDVAGTFAFPRLPLYVRGAPRAAAAAR